MRRPIGRSLARQRNKIATGKVRKRMREGLIASSGNASWVVDDVVDHYAAPRQPM
jgi:hypothetical protein